MITLKYIKIFYNGTPHLALQYGDRVIVEWDAAALQDDLWVDGFNEVVMERVLADPKIVGKILPLSEVEVVE